jgi:hypothetical protein
VRCNTIGALTAEMRIEERPANTPNLASDLRPRLLILFEGVDFHPPLEGRDAMDGKAAIDQFLNHVGERGLRQAAGFMETFCLIGLLRVTIHLFKGVDPSF